jgi:hypothetical protein
MDVSMGCASGLDHDKDGCYGDCYAARTAKRYGYDFSNTVYRRFKSESHRQEIVNKINAIKLDFVRIGGSGDPSENWQHTLEILEGIKSCNKQIVLITRHWQVLTDEQLTQLLNYRVCINTSVSALDFITIRLKALEQYNRLKPYCKSVLRVVTCKFNTDNIIGRHLDMVQQQLLNNEGVIDTVFRPSPKNKFLQSGVIIAKGEVFNGKKQLSSKANRKAYMGKCGSCLEMCGVELQKGGIERQQVKQVSLF